MLLTEDTASVLPKYHVVASRPRLCFTQKGTGTTLVTKDIASVFPLSLFPSLRPSPPYTGNAGEHWVK
jgi:hypothetical protein